MMFDPLAISGGGSAEENEVEIFELVIGNRRDHRRLIADFRQRSGCFACAVEQRHFGKWKRSIAKNGFDLIANERERIDDPHAITGVRLHGTCVASSNSSASGGGAVREGK